MKEKDIMMYTYHPVDDKAKVLTLAASMDENGWVGSPIVKWGEMHLLTGCHRYNAASKFLGWSDSDIPMIDLEELFVEDGKDFAALHEAHGFCTIDEDYEFVGLVHELSEEIRAKYGIEVE